MMKPHAVLPLVLVLPFCGCRPAVSAEDLASLKSDIAAVQADITATQTEDAKYTGGLVKSLIVLRIEVLRQTEAMLQQKLTASTFGISLKYAIDGKAFVPASNTKEALASVEQELADGAVKIRDQEAEAARYSGGLVQAMSLATLATTRQTQAMLDQKRLALKYGLPQYIGFHAQPDSLPATGAQAMPKSRPPAEASSCSNVKDFRIVSVDTRVTESNNTWSRYAWKVTVRNDSDQPHSFRGTIEFQDRDGFIVDTDTVNDTLVPAKSEQVSTGYALIRAEVVGKVAQTVARIGMVR